VKYAARPGKKLIEVASTAQVNYGSNGYNILFLRCSLSKTVDYPLDGLIKYYFGRLTMVFEKHKLPIDGSWLIKCRSTNGTT
jgi:hypothetical protein